MKILTQISFSYFRQSITAMLQEVLKQQYPKFQDEIYFFSKIPFFKDFFCPAVIME